MQEPRTPYQHPYTDLYTSIGAVGSHMQAVDRDTSLLSKMSRFQNFQTFKLSNFRTFASTLSSSPVFVDQLVVSRYMVRHTCVHYVPFSPLSLRPAPPCVGVCLTAYSAVPGDRVGPQPSPTVYASPGPKSPLAAAGQPVALLLSCSTAARHDAFPVPVCALLCTASILRCCVNALLWCQCALLR